MKTMRRLFAVLLVLALSICVLPLPTPAIISTSDIPVFVLNFEDEDSYLPVSCFLLQDPDSKETYLVTSDVSTELLDEGYTASVLGPNNFSTEAIYLTSSGEMAFYYAYGLSDYQPLLLGNRVGSKAIITAQTMDNNMRVKNNGLKTQSLTLSSWITKNNMMFSKISSNTTLDIGAPVTDSITGKVIGSGFQSTNDCIGFDILCDMDFPKGMSLQAIEKLALGDSSSSASSNVVSGKRSNNKFLRRNRYTYPFEFDEPLKSCRGFTLDYEITEVEKGGSMTGSFRYEVYVRTTGGNWQSVELFSMSSDSITVNIRFDERMSIDAVAVVCQKQSEYSYYDNMVIRDPIY